MDVLAVRTPSNMDFSPLAKASRKHGVMIEKIEVTRNSVFVFLSTERVVSPFRNRQSDEASGQLNEDMEDKGDECNIDIRGFVRMGNLGGQRQRDPILSDYMRTNRVSDDPKYFPINGWRACTKYNGTSQDGMVGYDMDLYRSRVDATQFFMCASFLDPLYPNNLPGVHVVSMLGGLTVPPLLCTIIVKAHENHPAPLQGSPPMCEEKGFQTDGQNGSDSIKRFHVKLEDGPLASFDVLTAMMVYEFMGHYHAFSHISKNTRFGPWLGKFHEVNRLWGCITYDIEFIVRLITHGLFILPERTIFLAPCPLERFCIDFSAFLTSYATKSSPLQALSSGELIVEPKAPSTLKPEKTKGKTAAGAKANWHLQNELPSSTEEKQESSQRQPTAKKWSSCKKLKQYGKEFAMSVNYNFSGSLLLARAYHLANHGSVWITPELIGALDHIRKSSVGPNTWEGEAELSEATQHSCYPLMWSFELWDVKTKRLCAAVFSYGIGLAASDFTVCTLEKDHRSCGSILTCAVGHSLQSCGYKFWYWGNSIPYMWNFAPYGGCTIPNSDFYRAWYDCVPVSEYDLVGGTEAGDKSLLPHASGESHPFVPTNPQTGSNLQEEFPSSALGSKNSNSTMHTSSVFRLRETDSTSHLPEKVKDGIVQKCRTESGYPTNERIHSFLKNSRGLIQPLNFTPEWDSRFNSYGAAEIFSRKRT